MGNCIGRVKSQGGIPLNVSGESKAKYRASLRGNERKEEVDLSETFIGKTLGSGLDSLSKKNSINKLDSNVQGKVFSYLRPSDLGAVCQSDKIRNEIVNSLDLKIKSFAFTSKDWKRFCKKDVDTEGERSSLPVDIYAKLNSPCPVFPGKRIGQTHMLVWIPKKAGGEPLTLNSLGRILKEYFPGNNENDGYRYVGKPIVMEHGEVAPAKSGWVLMTKDVLPGSRNRWYTDQQRLVANLTTTSLYEVPKILETVVCISARYFKFKERLFSDGPWTFTNCQEQTQGRQVFVGGFNAAGFFVVSDFDRLFSHDHFGVGVRLKKLGP